MNVALMLIQKHIRDHSKGITLSVIFPNDPRLDINMFESKMLVAGSGTYNTRFMMFSIDKEKYNNVIKRFTVSEAEYLMETKMKLMREQWKRRGITEIK